jgi:uncharacterized membrane protein
MATLYNKVSTQSFERLAALSDGVFAVAMTLLVLDLHAPAEAAIHSEQDLTSALTALAPKLTAYVMSFLTLGIFWSGQQTQLNFLARADRNLTWIHIGFLFAISILPFSTSLLAEFIGFRTALLVYWFNILLGGVALFGSWLYATRAGLARDNVTPEISKALEARVVIAQALYAFGAFLCVFSTYWSIAFIVLVQLNYAIAPKLPFLGKAGEGG